MNPTPDSSTNHSAFAAKLLVDEGPLHHAIESTHDKFIHLNAELASRLFGVLAESCHPLTLTGWNRPR